MPSPTGCKKSNPLTTQNRLLLHLLNPRANESEQRLRNLEWVKRLSRLENWLMIMHQEATGADPGFFLGGGAHVSCSTLTPINHIVFFFFAEYQLY